MYMYIQYMRFVCVCVCVCVWFSNLLLYSRICYLQRVLIAHIIAQDFILILLREFNGTLSEDKRRDLERSSGLQWYVEIEH